MTDSTRSNVNVLRARLESELETPAVILVTSAERGDGKSLTAFGLADTFAAARYRVLLIDANSGHPELLDAPAVGRLEWEAEDGTFPVRNAGRYDTLGLTGPELGAATPSDAVRGMMEWLHSRYDIVIVDGGVLLENTLTTMFASYVDATLVTLRLGRNAGPNDTATAAGLARLGARVLGVVTTERSAIKTFATRLRDTEYAPAARPASATPVTVPATVASASAVRYAGTITGDVHAADVVTAAR